MYLFTRTGRLAPGSIREAMGFVEEITDKVRQDTGLDLHVWASHMSPDLGTTVWAVFVDDLEQLQDAFDKLLVSESYLDLVEKGSRLWAGPLSDGLAQVVHGERDPSAPIPNFVSMVRATAANGQLTAAINNGVEIAETATAISGLRTLFLVDATGPYGGCRWTTGCSDIGELERSEAALMADANWLTLIDRVGPSYTPGATQAVYRRLS